MSRRRPRRTPLIEALEERVLYSADTPFSAAAALTPIRQPVESPDTFLMRVDASSAARIARSIARSAGVVAYRSGSGPSSA